MNALHSCRLLLISAALWFSFSFSAGCGYHFQGTGGGQPLISSLSIPVIKSPSTYLGFEGEFTEILREEFIAHGRIPLVEKEEASALLLADVSEILADPLSYRFLNTSVDGKTATYETTSSRRIAVRLHARLVDRVTGKTLWEDRNMEEKSSYAVGTDPLRNRYNRRAALGVIAERFARRLYLRTIEGF